MSRLSSRRNFLRQATLGAGLTGVSGMTFAAEKPIQGFEDTKNDPQQDAVWAPVSDRKIRMGIVGYGVCRFGAAFGFQDHPNVEVVAVSDLFPDRCATLAKVCRCEKTYPSLEEMVKDDTIEAIFVATDAPSHAKHCMLVMNHGKHVCCAVPSSFGSLEEAQQLYDVVKQTGKKYMLMETSAFHADLYAMREIYNAGEFGTMVYSEGEYFHYSEKPIDSYKGWRIGAPPQWYPTHSSAYYNCVTMGSYTEVSCMAIPSITPWLQAANNVYKNPFGTEVALFRTSEGGMARMGVSWDTPGASGEMGRVRGQKGTMYNGKFQGIGDISKLTLAKPSLPESVGAGGHGGSHGYLSNEFIHAILEDRKPLVDISCALNMTVGGIVAHDSALKDGELLKIPQYAPLT